MQEKVLKEAESKINDILDDGVNASNLEHLYKLVDIYKDMKEVECMYSGYGNYGNYGRGGNYGEYGRENYGNSYGRRGYDRKYRGHDHLDRMYEDYGRYMGNRERYGASEETDKSFHYMVEALENFVKVLHEEAETPQQKQMLNEVLQRSIR